MNPCRRSWVKFPWGRGGQRLWPQEQPHFCHSQATVWKSSPTARAPPNLCSSLSPLGPQERPPPVQHILTSTLGLMVCTLLERPQNEWSQPHPN